MDLALPNCMSLRRENWFWVFPAKNSSGHSKVVSRLGLRASNLPERRMFSRRSSNESRFPRHRFQVKAKAILELTENALVRKVRTADGLGPMRFSSQGNSRSS